MKLRPTIGITILVVAGCSGGPGAVSPPAVDAKHAAAQAIELYDKNGDGQLSKDEWSQSPALVAVAPAYDKNADQSLSADEIAGGMAAWQQAGIGARIVPFAVRIDGRPLAGATVQLRPAPFLEGSLKGASGTSSSSGGGQLNMSAEDRPRNSPNVPLMQPGLYYVEINHPSVKIPPKYNSQTTLGVEITSSRPGPEGLVWSLSTK